VKLLCTVAKLSQSVKGAFLSVLLLFCDDSQRRREEADQQDVAGLLAELEGGTRLQKKKKLLSAKGARRTRGDA